MPTSPQSELTQSETARLHHLYGQYVNASLNVNSAREFTTRLGSIRSSLRRDDFALFKRGAELGNTQAMCLLGASFIEGWVEKNTARGFEWLKKAAESGNAYAQQTIGGLYEHGRTPYIAVIGGDRNEAKKWYKLAVEQGDPRAQSALGLIYFEEFNRQDGFRLLNLAADQGIWSAMFNVALFYERGDYVTKDPAEALRRYRILAKQGNVKAKQKVRELGGPWWRRLFKRAPKHDA